MFPITRVSTQVSPRWPLQATVIACVISIALHTEIWHAWQGMNVAPPPETKPPVVIEVALTSPPSQAPAVAQVAPPPAPAPSKPLPKPPEKAKTKPVVKPKPKPVEKTPVAKKMPPTPEPKLKETPITDNLPRFTAPPAFTPAPVTAKTTPKPVPAAAAAAPSQSLVKAAYSAPGLKNPPTRYPKIAQMRQWEGVVLLEVQVLANGSAGNIKILKSSGHEILDESAIEQVKSWHFIPAHRGDKTVEDAVRVPVSFKLKS